MWPHSAQLGLTVYESAPLGSARCANVRAANGDERGYGEGKHSPHEASLRSIGDLDVFVFGRRLYTPTSVRLIGKN